MTFPPKKALSMVAARTRFEELGTQASDQSGVIIVLVAGLLVVILGMAALAIDVGSFYQAQRQAQSAADAAALAASQDLPTSTSAAANDGTTYGLKNFPTATVNVTPDYNNNSSQVQVKVTAQTPTFFGQLFGMTHATVSATAVAGGNGSAAPAAIFAYDDSCSGTGVLINGNSPTIDGSVISNGNLTLSTNPNADLQTGTYGGPLGCKFTNSSGKGGFQYGPTVNAALQAFPTDYSQNLPACTTTSTTPLVWSASGNKGSIPAGVYCAPEIDITGNNIYGGPTTDCPTCGVVFIAQKFVVSGNNDEFHAPGGNSNLLFYDTGTTPFEVSSNSIIIDGAIYAPSTTVQIDGNSAGTGFIEGNDVIINGNSFSITGAGPVMGGTGSSLIQ
jgi:Flp pilus assembly protein TadG